MLCINFGSQKLPINRDSMVEDIEILGVGDLKTTLADLSNISQSYLDHKLQH